MVVPSLGVKVALCDVYETIICTSLILPLTVFQPAIDLITEPDYINQKIIQYLEAQKEVDAMHVRTHEYAKTFEDYIRLINNCNNVDTLKRLRLVAMHCTVLLSLVRRLSFEISINRIIMLFC